MHQPSHHQPHGMPWTTRPQPVRRRAAATLGEGREQAPRRSGGEGPLRAFGRSPRNALHRRAGAWRHAGLEDRCRRHGNGVGHARTNAVAYPAIHVAARGGEIALPRRVLRIGGLVLVLVVPQVRRPLGRGLMLAIRGRGRPAPLERQQYKHHNGDPAAHRMNLAWPPHPAGCAGPSHGYEWTRPACSLQHTVALRRPRASRRVRRPEYAGER